MALIIIAIFCVIFSVSWAYIKWSQQYWKRRNVPYIEPTFPMGNFKNPFKSDIALGVRVKQLYDQLKQMKVKHGGIYNISVPNYMPLDLDYIKNIMTKDFQYFVDRGVYHNEKSDPLSAHLFAIGGIKWRNLRTKLTPTFTSGKMRMMFQTLVDCETPLRQTIERKYQNGEPLDVKEVLGCFTTDIIGSCAFGLEFNTFKDDDSPFRRYGKRVFIASKKQILQRMFVNNFPKLANYFGVSIIDKEVSDFFINLVNETVEYREKNNITRKDMLQLLIELKNKKGDGQQHDGTTLTMDEIAAQCFIFFLAGFETSSTTMTFALYEMAQHQEIQNKVRQEVITVLAKYNNEITYEAIQDMKYMTQVIEETLRKYPPVPFVTRKCIKDYKIPNTDVTIEKNIRAIIPIMGIHYDPDYYENPEKFDPERFNEENKSKRNQYSYMPFGEGPRICIGLRFGMMQTKVGLASMLRNYKFTLSPKTKQPMKFNPKSFILAVDGEVWLDIHKIGS